MIVIAHVSDVHIDAGERSVARTRAVFDHLEALPYDLDLVLVTGDIADHAEGAEYTRARKAMASRHPVLVCPGNHDDRATFREFLLDEPVGSAGAAVAPVDQVHRTDRFVVAPCDSSVPGEDYGRLEAATLTWLEGVLADTPEGVPVLVGLHHPPVPLAVPYVDGIRLRETDGLAELAGRYPGLAAFVCGHAHTAAATTFAGRPVLVAPGVVSTVLLPWETPVGSEEYVSLDAPPGLAFHVVDDEGRVTTHYRTVDVA
ncbi:metallophosphoesterase [Yinghuangia seranimata]|uniref:metallophosphoesterase n=1 Tax=Yinghuangia seranimata TaxID=408067 RepID=UPI00248C120B|nr:metallophosphoesterase [Yinghuangia seranimata]MDI2131851.1 metallophosphoesterase [Yinghuangia seranimata]